MSIHRFFRFQILSVKILLCQNCAPWQSEFVNGFIADVEQ